MSDIFREVEEDVRREKLEKFWKAYGDYVIALAAADHFGHRRLSSSGSATRPTSAPRPRSPSPPPSTSADPRQAADAFADLAKTAPGGYGLLARLEQANSMLASGQRETPSRSTRRSPARTRAASARWRGCARAGRWPTRARAPICRPCWRPSRRRAASGSRWPTKFSPIAIIAHHDLAKATQEFDALASDPATPGAAARRAPAPWPPSSSRAAPRISAPCRRPRRRPRPARPRRHAGARRHAMMRISQAPADRRRARGCVAAGRLRHIPGHQRHGGRLVRARQQIQAARASAFR